MWFKQLKVFQLKSNISYDPQEFIGKLEPLCFKPCLPSFPSSSGWISPFDDEDKALAHGTNGNVMFCLKIEEKILPGSVIQQEVSERIKKIQFEQDRKVRQKEKQTLKEEVTFSLLPKAFSKFTRIHAYIDTRENWLVINSNSTTRVELFLGLFRKTFGIDVILPDVKKVPGIMTQWLLNESQPENISIEKACVLQDPSQQTRVIRAKEQNLFSESIQSLLKDSCQVVELALAWHDRMQFVLTQDLSLRSIRYEDQILSQAEETQSETKEQQFDADFLIMAEELRQVILLVLSCFVPNLQQDSANASEQTHIPRLAKEHEPAGSAV